MNIKINVRGLDQLKRALDEDKVRPFLIRAHKRAVVYLVNLLNKYPARRSPRHKRTGELGRRWKGQVSNTGKTARVVNTVRYAHIVQGGTETRPWYETIGWVQTSGVAKDRGVLGHIEDVYQDEMDNYVAEFNRQ